MVIELHNEIRGRAIPDLADGLSGFDKVRACEVHQRPVPKAIGFSVFGSHANSMTTFNICKDSNQVCFVTHALKKPCGQMSIVITVPLLFVNERQWVLRVINPIGFVFKVCPEIPIGSQRALVLYFLKHFFKRFWLRNFACQSFFKIPNLAHQARNCN